MHHIALNDQIRFGNDLPFVLIGGMNVIEDRSLVIEVASVFQDVCQALDIPFIFKASFDKANRSSVQSFRGPGIEAGLRIFEEIKRRFNVPILTDIHEPQQAERVAGLVDIIQIPAFLARQTDLIIAAARTGAVLNIKKPQFLSPAEMGHILRKCADAGNGRVLLCERGSCFGYNNLVVDMLGMDTMRAMAPVVFDVTHALQKPGGRGDSADGRRAQAAPLARAGMALGIAGLFLEAHPNPDEAKCDGPSALPLAALRPFLEHVKAVDSLVKGLDPLMTGG